MVPATRGLSPHGAKRTGWWPAFGVLGALLASCTQGSDLFPSDPTTTRPGAAADAARAEAARLKLADFPTGWSEKPDDDPATTKGDLEFQSRAAACARSPSASMFGNVTSGANAATGTFEDPEGDLTVSQDIGLAASTDAARTAISGLGREDFASCLQSALRTYITDMVKHPPDAKDTLPRGASIGDVTIGRLNLPVIGDDLFGFRMTLPITYRGFALEFEGDFVFIRRGRAVTDIWFTSAGQPFEVDQIIWYSTIAANRLPGSP